MANYSPEIERYLKWRYGRETTRGLVGVHQTDHPVVSGVGAKAEGWQGTHRSDGVSWALEEIQRMPGGRARREIIQRVYFDNSHTLYGAALLVPIGEATAKRWNAEFIRLLAKNFDFP